MAVSASDVTVVNYVNHVTIAVTVDSLVSGVITQFVPALVARTAFTILLMIPLLMIRLLTLP